MNDAELRKMMAEREAKSASKIKSLLDKGSDMKASEVRWLRQKEVDRHRIAKAMGMSISTFERYLTNHGLTEKTEAAQENPKKKKKGISLEIKTEIRGLLANTNMSRREIANRMNVSYIVVDYQKRQMEKERENVSDSLNENYEDKIKQLEERIRMLKRESDRFSNAHANQSEERQRLESLLQDEEAKVRERDKMIERLTQERDALSNRFSEQKGQEYQDMIKQLEERNQTTKQELKTHQKAIEKLKADRQSLYEDLREERSKVKEREKVLDQLNNHVQNLISEREDLMKKDKKEILQKRHDLLLEYISAGGNA